MPDKPYADWVLSEWLDFLENRHQQEVQLRLVNARVVAEKLDILKFTCPVITVTGTNGKGSTVAALSAIYMAAGYRVGCFTSPHLLKFNERICVNNQPISDVDLCRLFALIEEERDTTSITYFEASLLACLLYFKESNLDIIVLEVGVGGRLDATNIIDADLAIITTVDLDHLDYLGQDKEAIGYEKAGIMRANKSCIYADDSPPKSVISQALALGVSMSCLSVKDLALRHDSFNYYSFNVCNDKLHITRDNKKPIVVTVPGINLKSAVAAILATEYLTIKCRVETSHIETAMRIVNIPGRQQLVKGDISVLYDVAHNPQAVSLLADYIQKYQSPKVIHAVFSGLKDKDLCGLISPMSSLVTHWYPALLPGKRAASDSLLSQSFLSEIGYTPMCYNDPLAAFNVAKQAAKSGDLIVVYGSFLLVSAVMEGLEYETSIN